MLKITGKPVTVCGVRYVDVMTEHGPATMLESQVKLINKLMVFGLTEQAAKDLIHDEIMDYAHQLRDENEID